MRWACVKFWNVLSAVCIFSVLLTLNVLLDSKGFVRRQFLNNADRSVQSQTIISEELYVPKTCGELPLKSLVRTLELLRRGLKNNLCSTITLLLLSWTFVWGMEIDSEEALKQFKWKEGIDKCIILYYDSGSRACYGRCLMSVYSTIIQQAPLYLNVKDIIESFLWLLLLLCARPPICPSLKQLPVFLSGGPLQWEFTSCCSSGQQVWSAASWHVPQVAQTGELLQGIRLRRLVWNLCKGKMLQWSIFFFSCLSSYRYD